MKINRYRLNQGSLFVCFFAILLSFQNCGPGFQVQKPNSALGLSGANSHDNPVDPTGPVANNSKISVQSADVMQGQDIIFPIVLDQSSATDISVQIETKQGTAIAGIDFEILKTTVVIPKGQVKVSVAVNSLVFSPALTNKTLSLVATATSSGTIVQAEGSATIHPIAAFDTYKFIATSERKTCGITLQDTVKCWGDNFEIPTAVPGLTGVIEVSVGNGFGCALLSDTTVRCWGLAAEGQLGNNAVIDSQTPVLVVGLSGIKHLASGYGSTCVITAQDTVKCWGAYIASYILPVWPFAMAPIDIPGLVNVKQVVPGLKALSLA